MADGDGIKYCNLCKESKSISLFAKCKGKKDGLQSNCKACSAARYAANREKRVAWQAEYNAVNRDRIRFVMRERYAANKERILARQRENIAAKPDVFRGYRKLFYERHREKVRRQTAAYQKDNRQKVNAYRRKQYAEDRTPFASGKGRRRDRVKASKSHFTRRDVERLMYMQRCKCAVCAADIAKRYHIDHIVPFARGGTNEADNIQLLCPTCNLQKSAKDPIDFMQSKGFLL